MTQGEVWKEILKRADSLVEKSASSLTQGAAIERVMRDRTLQEQYLDAEPDALAESPEVQKAEQPGDREWEAVEKAARALVVAEAAPNFYEALSKVVDEQPELYAAHCEAAGLTPSVAKATTRTVEIKKTEREQLLQRVKKIMEEADRALAGA